MILSRKAFALLKTGMASPTIALVAPRASIGDQMDKMIERAIVGERCTDLEQFKLASTSDPQPDSHALRTQGVSLSGV